MTEQSSCKSFFGAYLLYRIKQQKTNLILNCILSTICLPILALAINDGFAKQVSDFCDYGKVCAVIGSIMLAIAVLIGASGAFEFYNKKELIDTLGSLPLSYKQRFFGDLLGGYITNVAPVIPCGLISVVIFACSQKNFENYTRLYNISEAYFTMTEFGVCTALALFFMATFTYLISVAVASCCGSFIHSVFFSVIFVFALPYLAAGFTGSFTDSIIGTDSAEYFRCAWVLFPPMGLLTEFWNFNNINYPYRTNFWQTSVVLKPGYLVFWVILAAVLIAAAYFIGKSRKVERTGSDFTVKPAFYAFDILATAAAVALFLHIVRRSSWKYYVSAVAGAAMCLVIMLICLPKKKALLRGMACGAAAVSFVLLISLLFNKTGAFGLRYIPENADKLEYIKINDEFTITDKADIETFSQLHNSTLRAYAKVLDYDDNGYEIEYKTSSGRTVRRSYSENNVMKENETKLDGYRKYFFDALDSIGGVWTCRVAAAGGSINVPVDRMPEFIEILRGEASEKYDRNLGIYGKAYFMGEKNREFPIQLNYEKTIAFLNSLDETDTEVYDPEAVYMEIVYTSTNFGDDNYTRIDVSVKVKEKDDELVKELFGLLVDENNRDEMNEHFKVIITNDIRSGSYFVANKNTGRALEIVEGLAFRDFE